MTTVTVASTFEEELEGLLDRQRMTLRRLWASSFLLVTGIVIAAWILLDLGPIGWGVLALVVLIGFLALQGAVGEYRAAHEAVVRRVARR